VCQEQEKLVIRSQRKKKKLDAETSSAWRGVTFSEVPQFFVPASDPGSGLLRNRHSGLQVSVCQEGEEGNF